MSRNSWRFICRHGHRGVTRTTPHLRKPCGSNSGRPRKDVHGSVGHLCCFSATFLRAIMSSSPVLLPTSALKSADLFIARYSSLPNARVAFYEPPDPMRTRLLSLAVIVAVNVAQAHGVPPVLTLTRADASIVFQTSHRRIIALGGSSHFLNKLEQTLAEQLQQAYAAEQLMVADRDDVHYYVILTQECPNHCQSGRATAAPASDHTAPQRHRSERFRRTLRGGDVLSVLARG